MTGQDLRRILMDHGVVMNKLADELEMSQPALSQMFRTQDIKSGILEKICDIFQEDLNYFYEGTKYDPLLKDAAETIKMKNVEELKKGSEVKKEYDKLLKEYYILQGKYEGLEKAYEMAVKHKIDSNSKAMGI